jgi:phosphatidylinositol-3-phosphatase
MWRWLIPVAVACLAAFALVKTSQHPVHIHRSTVPTDGRTATTGPDTPCGTATSHPAVYKHVVWIVFGERGFAQVIGKHTKAQYVNTLASDCGLATGYSSVTHPALPNLVASFAGSTGGILRNHCQGCQTPAPSLFKQVPSWAVYMESMPAPCRTTDAPARRYIARMNPAIFFRGLRACRSRDLPLGSQHLGPLSSALDKETLPRLVVIVPNECHSMSFSHDCGAHRVGEFVALGDLWLQGWMQRLLSSKEYRSGSTAIFITWLDGTPGVPLDHDCVRAPLPSCRVAAVVLAPSVKAGTIVSTRFSHYSLLRTTEALLGIRRHLGGAHRAPGMRVAFGL